MAIVNIAFSAGVESTYLVQKALEEGHTVNPVVINVSGSRKIFAMDVEFCIRSLMKLGELKTNCNWKGELNKLHLVPNPPVPCPYYHHRDNADSLMRAQIQQVNTVLGMIDVRRRDIKDYYPTVWIGWIKEDAAEHSGNEFDFREEQYLDLLNLNKTFGPLSRADCTGAPFRAPLWEMSKRSIFDKLNSDIDEYLIPNIGKVFSEGENVYFHFTKEKLEELKDNGLSGYYEDKGAFKVEELHYLTRLFLGRLSPEDLDLKPDASLGVFENIILENAFGNSPYYAIPIDDLPIERPRRWEIRDSILGIVRSIDPDAVDKMCVLNPEDCDKPPRLVINQIIPGKIEFEGIKDRSDESDEKILEIPFEPGITPGGWDGVSG